MLIRSTPEPGDVEVATDQLPFCSSVGSLARTPVRNDALAIRCSTLGMMYSTLCVLTLVADGCTETTEVAWNRVGGENAAHRVARATARNAVRATRGWRRSARPSAVVPIPPQTSSSDPLTRFGPGPSAFPGSVSAGERP